MSQPPQYSDMKPAPGYEQTYAPQQGPPPTQTVIVTAQPEQRPSSTGTLILSIISIFCCCPFGLAAIICTVKAGDEPTAVEAERRLSTAKKFAIAAIVLGIVGCIISIISQVVAASSTHHTV